MCDQGGDGMQEESVFDSCNDKCATSQIAYSEKYTSSGGVVVYFSNILKPRIFSIEIWEIFVILSSINLDRNNL